jgi:GNAT superfamily N-acetyltransferase
MTRTMSFQITPITPAELPDLLRLVRGLAEYEHLEHLMVAKEDDYRDALFGAHPSIEAIIAKREGRAVGFALFFHNFSTFLGKSGIFLEDIFVEPESRGQGIGEALIRHIGKLAVERNCGRFEWTVLDWNEPAIRFYEKMGATILKEWRVVRTTGEALRQLAGGAD